MSQLFETIRFCKRARMEGGPFGLELFVKALHLPDSMTDVLFDSFRSWRWSLTRILYGYRFVHGVLSCQRGINLKAPNEVVFQAFTDPRTEKNSFNLTSFRYRHFFWHRYCHQIYVDYEFNLLPFKVQSWVIDMVHRHFRGESTDPVVIEGTEAAWESITNGAYKQNHPLQTSC